MMFDENRLVFEGSSQNLSVADIRDSRSAPAIGLRQRLFSNVLPENSGLGLDDISFYSALKRGLDIAVSFSLLVLLSPVFLVLAVLIKATDRGPVFFHQARVGRNGREFHFSKFRSMVPNAEQKLASIAHLNEHKTGVTFKVKNDPRITWIGKFLRRTSMDELPQLWSVLVGDMTLVGPRPALPREVAKYTPEERRRLDVTPGLTGIWQVKGRGDLPFPVQVAMDIEYIEKRSFLLDMKLMFLTIPAVLSGKGAY